jgi:parallel beta-helix repeat protein
MLRTLVAVALPLLFGARATGAEFTVTSTSDSGAGSLRQAITDANALTGTDSIVFNIPGGGVQTISPTSALPTITSSVSIDGYTQPGASANTLAVGTNATLLIVLNGLNAGSATHGLRLTAGNCTVRGLVINDFSYAGILVSSGDGNIIAGNYIGTNATGNAAVPNGRGTMWDGICIGEPTASANNVIGGASPADRNVISGNNGGAIWITASAGNNTIRGNYLGVDASGTSAIRNVQHGIILAGSGNAIIANVISGNGGGGYYGVYLPSGANGTTITGNLIGVDATGASAIPNQETGLMISSNNNTIGGTTPGAGNVISGNAGYGVQVSGVSGNLIQGNHIGTNAAGTAGLTNGNDGIGLINATDNTVGGTSTAARNVISGNVNVANLADGIWITGGSGNTVQGNYIGTDATGTVAIGNYHAGVALVSTTGNMIGGTAAGAGNLIALNTGRGVVLSSSARRSGILGNSIFGNRTPGIDLGDNGRTANNGTKSSSQANYGMDSGVFTIASLCGNTLFVNGYVGSASGQTTFANARVEVFKANDDGSGYGQGQFYLGFVTTDANGKFSGSLTVSGLSIGDEVTATATDANNNTSEFGANATVTAPVIIKWREVPNPDPLNP